MSASKKSFISGGAKGQIVLRSAQGPNEAVGVDTIDAEGGGRVRRRYDVLKERDSARNPALLDVELMDCAASGYRCSGQKWSRNADQVELLEP